MKTGNLLTRRDFLGGVAALGAWSLAGCATPSGGGSGRLPVRGEFVVRDAYVMTMDAAGDLPGADVYVRNGEIAAVGVGVAADRKSVV